MLRYAYITEKNRQLRNLVIQYIDDHNYKHIQYVYTIYDIYTYSSYTGFSKVINNYSFLALPNIILVQLYTTNTKPSV